MSANKPNIPSQPTPTSSGDKPTGTPKTTESGIVKDSATGNTKNAADSAKTESKIANTPTTKTLAETQRSAATAPTPAKKPLDKNLSMVKGEIMQGDSFRLTVKRGNITLMLPVPVEGSRNVVILDNTFRIVDAILNAESEDELRDKFASFVQ